MCQYNYNPTILQSKGKLGEAQLHLTSVTRHDNLSRRSSLLGDIWQKLPVWERRQHTCYEKVGSHWKSLGIWSNTPFTYAATSQSVCFLMNDISCNKHIPWIMSDKLQPHPWSLRTKPNSCDTPGQLHMNH